MTIGWKYIALQFCQFRDIETTNFKKGRGQCECRKIRKLYIGDKWLSWYSFPPFYGSSQGSNPDTLSKIQNGRHKQRSGQHTQARQKNIQKKLNYQKRAVTVSNQLTTLKGGGLCGGGGTVILLMCNRGVHS